VKAKRLRVVVAAALVGLGLIGCGKSDNASSAAAPVFNLNFIGGQIVPGERPAAAPGPSAPVIRDTDYYPITRQGGSLHGVITFDDDDYTGVTTLVLQFEGSGQYFTFDVTPLDDPLNPGTTTINFTISLDPLFLPGTYTLYMGLIDEDGNVGDYVARLLVVKSLADLTIASLDPADGSADVGANAVVRAEFSQQVLDGEAEIVVEKGGAPVAGTTRLSSDGRTMVFTPDDLFEPGAVYQATAAILVSGVSRSSAFTILNPPPLSDPSALADLVFALNLAEDNLVEPREGKALFSIISVLPAILTKVVSVDAGTGAMTSVGGMGQDTGGGVYQQVSLAPAFGPNPGLLDNPWFSLGPSRLVIPLAPLGLPGELALDHMMLSGHFITDGGGAVTGFEQGVVTARVNSADINGVLEVLMGYSVDLCQLIPICDADGMVWIRAENISSPVVSGIDFLYGINCQADPDSINAAAGGDIDVTCTETRDGAGFQVADIAFSALTGPAGGDTAVGAWNYLGESCSGTPPVCAVPASGQVTVRLTLDPDELTAGDRNFRVGGAYSSPPGPMATARAIAVQ